MLNHGGSVIAHPRVHNLYVGGSFWNFTGVSLRSQLDGEWSNLLTTRNPVAALCALRRPSST